MRRGVVFALACTGLAAAAHAVGHGGAPPMGVLVAATAVVTAAVMPFAGRSRGTAPVVAAMVGAQAGLHTWFALATRSPGRMTAALESTLCLPERGALPDAVLRHMLRVQAPLLPAPHRMPIAPWHAGTAMLGSHLLAAGLTAVLLAHCDDTVTAAARLLAILAAVLAATTTVPRRPAATPVDARQAPFGPVPTADRRPPATRRIGHALVRRGPPARSPGPRTRHHARPHPGVA
jgi:hypothetical protein